MNVTELAKAVGVSRKQFYEWRKLGCQETTVDGVIAWRDQNVRLQVGGNAVKKPETAGEGLTPQQRKLAADARLAEAKAIAQELKNQQARGELARIDDVLQSIAERDLRTKTRLESIPDELEMSIPADVRSDVKAELKEKIRLILKEMSDAPAVEIPDADFDS